MSERLAALLAAVVLAAPAVAAQSASEEAVSPASPEAAATPASLEVHEIGAPPVRAPERTYQALFGSASSEEAAAPVSAEAFREVHDPMAIDLLNQMAAAHTDLETLEGTFTQHKVSELFLDAIDSTGRFSAKRPDSFRYDYDANEETGTQTYWQVGDIVSFYSSDLRQLEVYDFSDQANGGRSLSHLLLGLDQAVEELQAKYWIQIVPPGEDGAGLGNNVAHLRLVPRHGVDETGATRLELWLDRSTLLPSQVKVVEESGDETTLRITSLNLNPALGAATFNPQENIPEGTEIVENQTEMNNRP